MIERIALYGTSRILGLGRATSASAGLRKALSRLQAMFEGISGVAAGDRGVMHEKSGLVFTELILAGSQHLVCGSMTTGSRLTAGVPVEIVTGSCMFARESIIGRSRSGVHSLTSPKAIAGVRERIIEIEIDDRLTVYEIETIARLSHFIRKLSDRLTGSAVTVNVHLPVPEYTAYGLTLYAAGVITPQTLLRYNAAVRRRGALLGEMFATCLRMPSVTARIGSPLAWIEDVDVLDLAPSRVPSLLFEMATGRDRLWRDLVGESVDAPLMHLNHLSYVYQYLSTARRARAAGAQLIFVEDPEETPIYRHALDACARTGTSLKPAFVFYVHPRVVVVETADPHDGNWLHNCKDGFNRCHLAAVIRPYEETGVRQFLST